MKINIIAIIFLLIYNSLAFSILRREDVNNNSTTSESQNKVDLVNNNSTSPESNIDTNVVNNNSTSSESNIDTNVVNNNSTSLESNINTNVVNNNSTSPESSINTNKVNNNSTSLENNTEPAIKVSIIIPTHDNEEYIERSVMSALNQTLHEIEVIVINDASTDKTVSIVEELMKKDSRIKLIHNKKKSGVGRSRNAGINKAKGEFIGFIDSDDFVDPKWFEVLYNNSKNKDWVRGVRVFNNFGNPNISKKKNNPYGCLVPSIIRKEFIDKKKLRFISIRRTEDVYFYNLIKRNKPRTKKVKDNGVYYHYCRREGSLSKYKNPNKNKNNNNNNNNKNQIKDKIYPNFSIILCISGLIIVIVIFIYKRVKSIENLKILKNLNKYDKLDMDKNEVSDKTELLKEYS